MKKDHKWILDWVINDQKKSVYEAIEFMAKYHGCSCSQTLELMRSMNLTPELASRTKESGKDNVRQGSGVGTMLNLQRSLRFRH